MWALLAPEAGRWGQLGVRGYNLGFARRLDSLQVWGQRMSTPLGGVHGVAAVYAC